MAISIEDLLAQKSDLDRQIREAQKAAKAEALERIRTLMTEHGLTVADLAMSTSKNGAGGRAKVPPKFRDPVSGLTWSGRGLKPRWLSTALESGRSLDDFAI